MKNLSIIGALLFASVVFSQNTRDLKLNEKEQLIEAVYYYDNGQVSQKGTYDATNGELHGEWIHFDKDGNKKTIAFYENGQKEGKWVFFVEGDRKEVIFNKNVASL